MSRDLWEEERDDRPGGGLARKIGIAVVALAGLVLLGVAGFVAVALQGLPGLRDLQNYQPPVTSRVHAGDGALVAEFAEQHRIFVPIQSIPDHVRQAFIAAEDQHFNEHVGVDPSGLMRATISNVVNVIRGRRLQGASTITQQVAKNMLLSPDRTVMRKVREAILALRIEQALSKDQILELYLNEIFLGRRAYGVGAAALNYFNKPLQDLTISEAAFLGGLPKAPGNYDPVSRAEAAVTRRNYVIGRMEEQGFISHAEAEQARAARLETANRLAGDQYIAARPFVEEVRRLVVAQNRGDSSVLLRGGLSIRSTLDTRLQMIAARAVRQQLETYDRRHAWRGPIAAGDPQGDAAAQLRAAASAPALTGWLRAMVTNVQGGVRVRTETGTEGRLVDSDAQWAQSAARDKRLRAGSIVYVAPASQSGRFNLKQKPQVQGALVAMDPHTGRVLAMVGGYNLAEPGFNRATQAQRQPGSAYKPIVYAAALDYGLTPATLVDDGPLSIEAGDGSIWSPENYSHEFLGPTTLRRGLEQSRNAMTARIAYEMGIDRVAQYGVNMGVYNPGVTPVFSMALGAVDTTVLRMTTAYGEFVNGGKRITPSFIDRIQDRNGRTVFRVDQRGRECAECNAPWRGQAPPALPDPRQQVLDPITAYQVVSMTQGVVERGTGMAALSLGRPLGGKTGTSNDYRNAWWVGYSPDLVVGVWTGFDDNRSMGNGETGAQMGLPIFINFMREALKDTPPTPFRIPSGVRLVRIDAMTGLLPNASTTSTILEAFRPDTEPKNDTVSGSPFVFGGTDPIDPRVLAGVEGVSASQGAGSGQAGAQTSQRPDDLGGLY
ncbi:MAG: penicillin-binding protein 1A [Hyphomonadaceae bacterium]